MPIMETILDPLILPAREGELTRLALASMEQGVPDEKIGSILRRMQAKRIESRVESLLTILAIGTGRAEVGVIAGVVSAHAAEIRKALRALLAQEVAQIVADARKQFDAGERAREDEDEPVESLAKRAVERAQAMRLDGAQRGRISRGGPRGNRELPPIGG